MLTHTEGEMDNLSSKLSKKKEGFYQICLKLY